jgi:hypothetical protein
LKNIMRMLAALVVLVGAAFAVPAFAGNDKVGICHRTGSESNPYVYLSVPADKANGHITGDAPQHKGDGGTKYWEAAGEWDGRVHAAGDPRLDYYASEGTSGDCGTGEPPVDETEPPTPTETPTTTPPVPTETPTTTPPVPTETPSVPSETPSTNTPEVPAETNSPEQPEETVVPDAPEEPDDDPVVQTETYNHPDKTVKVFTHESGEKTRQVIHYDADRTEEGL